mgnify:CR=1 FL=1
MKLEDYLYFEKKKKKKFAAEIGLSYSHLIGILRGQRRPSLEYAMRIKIATNGKVNLTDLGVTLPAGIVESS